MKDDDKTKEDLNHKLMELERLLKYLEATKEECRRALDEAREARIYAENIVETIREPLLVLDSGMKVLSANRSFYSAFRVNPEETIGRNIYELGNRQWDIPALRKLLEGILPRNTQFNNFEVEHNFLAIGHKVMMLNARQIHTEEAGRRKILLAIEDVTELRKLEKVRKNILSMFAHDMKNPLVTSEGFLSRIISGKAGDITKKQQDYIEIIRSELGKVTGLIYDFLEFSKFETQEYKPLLALFDLQTEIRKNIETEEIEAKKKNIKMVFELPDSAVPPVNADAAMINRVIINLLDNAIKYTGPGGAVTVGIAVKGIEILVWVKDTGRGIPKEHLPFIFDLFYRVERNQRGSGLGLAIARMVIEAHGGRIWAESEPGEGSVFRFTLPAGQWTASSGGQ